MISFWYHKVIRLCKFSPNFFPLFSLKFSFLLSMLSKCLYLRGQITTNLVETNQLSWLVLIKHLINPSFSEWQKSPQESKTHRNNKASQKGRLLLRCVRDSTCEAWWGWNPNNPDPKGNGWESDTHINNKASQKGRLLLRCVRDSNPWPHAWQACILTKLN